MFLFKFFQDIFLQSTGFFSAFQCIWDHFLGLASIPWDILSHTSSSKGKVIRNVHGFRKWICWRFMSHTNGIFWFVPYKCFFMLLWPHPIIGLTFSGLLIMEVYIYKIYLYVNNALFLHVSYTRLLYLTYWMLCVSLYFNIMTSLCEITLQSHIKMLHPLKHNNSNLL